MEIFSHPIILYLFFVFSQAQNLNLWQQFKIQNVGCSRHLGTQEKIFSILTSNSLLVIMSKIFLKYQTFTLPQIDKEYQI